MPKKTPGPDDIILARRTAEHPVSVDFAALYGRMADWAPQQRMLDDGQVRQGDLIPMRYEEATGRDDFEPALDAPAEAPKET